MSSRLGSMLLFAAALVVALGSCAKERDPACVRLDRCCAALMADPRAKVLDKVEAACRNTEDVKVSLSCQTNVGDALGAVRNHSVTTRVVIPIPPACE